MHIRINTHTTSYHMSYVVNYLGEFSMTLLV